MDLCAAGGVNRRDREQALGHRFPANHSNPVWIEMSGGTVARVLDYYEELWERLPEDAVAPDFERRRAFLAAATKPGVRALDLGCGGGDFTAALAEAGAIAVGVDVAEAALRRARARYPA